MADARKDDEGWMTNGGYLQHRLEKLLDYYGIRTADEFAVVVRGSPAAQQLLIARLARENQELRDKLNSDPRP